MRGLILIIISVVAICFCSVETHAQKKIKSKSWKKEYTIEDAKQSASTNPTEAIKIISEIITTAKEENQSEQLIEAYILLGDINEVAGIPTLALDRYNQALEVMTRSNTIDLLAPLQQKRGSLLFDIKDPEALAAYESCMKNTQDDLLYHICYEGLANAEDQQGDQSKAIEILDKLETYYKDKDASSLARIQARKAIIASSRKDIEGAKINFSNVQSNFKRAPNEGAVSDADYGVIESAKEAIIAEEDDIEKEIDYLEENIAPPNANVEYQIIDQVQLANAYNRKGDISAAIKSINTAKNLINKEVKSETVSELYKEASKLSAAQGQYAQALEEYKQYENSQQLVIAKKERDLENRITLLENQKTIDINENIYDSNQRLGVSEKRVVNFQQYIIYLLLLLLLLALASAWWIYKSLRAKNIANKKLELQSLRAQMNPHFIFNALNSVNEFIATQDEKQANKYLTQFSKLMRKVLELNKKDLIPLSEELELTELYLQLEHSRFLDKFDYTYNIAPVLKQADISVPPLLLQPYIENAIWHGLRYKEEKGRLEVMAEQEDKEVKITIRDNGIGRKKSIELKTTNQKLHKSTGMRNTASRMAIIQELYDKNFSITIDEAYPKASDVGTQIVIKLAN